MRFEHCHAPIGLELGPRNLDHNVVAEPDAVADQDSLGLGNGLGYDHGLRQREPHHIPDDEPLLLQHQDGLCLRDGLDHGQLDALGLGDRDCDGDLDPGRSLRWWAVL